MQKSNLLITFLLFTATTSINVREYDNLECAGEECKLATSTMCYRTVAVAASNYCERDGTITSMTVFCRAGAVVMTKWQSTDCVGTGVEDSIRLQSDVCTPFPMQNKAVYYDCSSGYRSIEMSLSVIMLIIIAMFVHL